MSGREKRKEPPSDAVSAAARNMKPRDDGDDAAATEDEVEEFFAILRRIHVAVRYFKRNGGGEKLSAAEGSEAMLEWASNRTAEEASGVEGEPNREDVNAGLDLNVNPGPEEDPV